nr:ABC transporter permease [uncultured Rhodoferax sp.]
MSADVLLNTASQYWDGLWITVVLTLGSLALGLCLAIPLAVWRISVRAWVSKPVALYTWAFRGTPLLAQLMIVYYGLGQFEWLQNAWQQGDILWLWLRDPFWCALLALTLNTAAYTTEILAGVLRTTPYGEVEAAQAYGMGRWQVLHRILLPSALRRFIPAYSNEAIFMLHGTSLVSAITIVDLMGAARDFNANFYVPFEAFMAAGVVYFALTWLLTVVARMAERKYLRHTRPLSAVTAH